MPIIVRNVRTRSSARAQAHKDASEGVQKQKSKTEFNIQQSTNNSQQFTSWKNYTNISDASYLHLNQIKRDVFILFVWEAIHGNRILKQKCSTIFTSIFSWDEVVMYVHISFCGNFWHGEEDGRNIYGRSCDHNCIFWQERQGLGQWPRHEDGALSAG